MSQPTQALRRFMEVSRPQIELLDDGRMKAYSELLRLLLKGAGVSEPYYGKTTITTTPEYELSDGMTVQVHHGPVEKMLDEGNGPYARVVPDAILRVTGPPSPEPAYPITYEPVIAHGGKVYVHSGAPGDIYRPANYQDDEALRGAFRDLNDRLQALPLE